MRALKHSRYNQIINLMIHPVLCFGVLFFGKCVCLQICLVVVEFHKRAPTQKKKCFLCVCLCVLYAPPNGRRDYSIQRTAEQSAINFARQECCDLLAAIK